MMLRCLLRRRPAVAPAPVPTFAHARTLCAVAGCDRPHTVDTHGWKTCEQHSPERRSASDRAGHAPVPALV